MSGDELDAATTPRTLSGGVELISAALVRQLAAEGRNEQSIAQRLGCSRYLIEKILRQDALSRRERRLRTCGCGKCGLEFPPTRGRSIHPQCPNRKWKRHASGAPLRDRHLLAGPPKPRRCPECEGMPHVRPPEGCCLCGQPYAPERIRASDGSPACALGLL